MDISEISPTLYPNGHGGYPNSLSSWQNYVFFHHGNVGNTIFSVPKVTAYAGVVAQALRRWRLLPRGRIGADRNGDLMVI